MANGKWITGLKPGMSVAEAAARVLTERLEAVRHHFRPAVEVRDADVEHVHQLRVATRRCRAALDIFQEVLRPRTRERLRKLLRAVRRAAGPARDADVLLLDLAERLKEASSRNAPGLHWAAGQLAARRSVAQQHLCEAFEELGSDLDGLEIKTLPKKQLRDSRWGRKPLRLAARELLQAHLQALEAAQPAGQQPEQLHQMRIAGKRLRYAMEVFGDCFPPDFRQVFYPQVEGLQEILGEVNDAFTAGQVYVAMQEDCIRFYPGLWPTWRDGIQALIKAQGVRQKTALKQFKRFWQQWQKEQVGERFRGLLA